MLATGAADVYMNQDLIKEYDVKPEATSQLVSELGSVKGIKAWVFFIEEEDQIRIRLRSKGPTINGLAQKYRGGGHPLASGASVYSWEEADRVVCDLIELCKED